MNWQAWPGYVLSLLLLSWAHAAGVDAAIVALTGVAIGLAHWLLPPLTATFLLLGAGQLVSLANAEKLRDTGDAILWQDIAHVLPNVFGNLGTLWQYVGAKGLVIGALALLTLLLAAVLERMFSRRSRVIGAAFSAILMVIYLPAAVDHAIAVDADLALFAQSPKSFAGRPGANSLARFLHSVNLPPAEFDRADTDRALFREQAPELPVRPPPHPAERPPDIFVVLNESQFSPLQIADCATRNDCSMSLYEGDGYSALRGPLKVHTHGWGTWNAEFTLMTGIPHYWFGENGFYSAYTVAPRLRMALARHLSAMGYRTIGIYPTQKGMLNAGPAYRQYGIQEFHGAEDLGLSLDWCQVPDSLMYEKALSKYREARKEDSRPIFLVMLTVFNHGPHGSGCMDPALAAATAGAGPRVVKLEDYLHRSRAADLAAAAFRKVLLALPQRALLLFAGDHQPSFEGLAAGYGRRMHRPMPAADTLLFTNYQFFANYVTPIPAGGDGRLRELDVSFLASSLLEMAMLPLGPLFEPNLRLRILCDGRLDSCPAPTIDSYKANLKQVGFYE